MKRTILSSLILYALLPLWLTAQNELVDLGMVYMIKQEGMKNSDIEELAFWMTDYSGPRLTASGGSDRGTEWAKRKMEEYGLQNVRIEIAGTWDQGGWDNKMTYAAMTSPYYASFSANPVAWTGSTKGTVRGEVIFLDINTERDLDRYIGKIKGKIILLPSIATDMVNYELMMSKSLHRYTDQELEELAESVLPSRETLPPPDSSISNLTKIISEFLRKERAGVILNESRTRLSNVPASTGVLFNSGDAEPIPELNLPPEAFGRMKRLIQHGVPVEVEIKIRNTFNKNPYVYNVIGEIPGTDPVLKDEIVLIGAHLDSWHGGTGAGDNAAGCIVMLDAMRIIKTLNIQPRRTIRIALWGGEEHGFLGSRGYVEKYLFDSKTKHQKPDYDRFSVCFNMDNATGRFRGIYLQGNLSAKSTFKEWLKPFEDLGCSTVSIRSYGNTDHVVFDEINLPGFAFIQERNDNAGAHHTIADTYERLNMSDLRYNAVIMASMAYFSAMSDQKIPRKSAMDK